MGLEAFLIFISSLISMNSNNQSQTIDDHAKQQAKETGHQTPNSEASPRGGWDHN